MKNKKGLFSIAILFIIVAIFSLILFAVVSPMGAAIGTRLYGAGLDVINMNNDTVNGITDASVKQTINDGFTSASNMALTNIQINTDMFKYAGFLVVSIVFIVLFLRSRQLVEAGGGGFA